MILVSNFERRQSESTFTRKETDRFQANEKVTKLLERASICYIKVINYRKLISGVIAITPLHVTVYGKSNFKIVITLSVPILYSNTRLIIKTSHSASFICDSVITFKKFFYGLI